MNIQRVKEVLIVIILIVCALAFIGFLALAIHTLYRTQLAYFGVGQDEPSIYGTCEKFDDKYVVSVNITTFQKEMKDIKCKPASTGGMIVDKEEENIAMIPPHSSDFCDFYLKGERMGPIRIRVTYFLKSLLGYKEYSTVIEPYCPPPKEEPSPNH